MKLSARNQLKGKIVEVKKGATTAHVRIDVGGQIVTASITDESADELKLAVGQTAYAIVKASSVMVGWTDHVPHRLLIAALMSLLVPASAAEDGCGKFAWPLAREQALLAAADKAERESGSRHSRPSPKTAFVVNLQPGAEAAFAMPPERKPQGGALVRRRDPVSPRLEKPGIYQVTLSEEAWIDVVQDDRYARSVGSTGRGDCPGLRKSVRLDLGAAPFVLQISGVTSELVDVAVGARE